MFTTTFTRRFSAAHRVAGDPGVCHRIHGHNYECLVTIESDALDATNFVLPADLVKECVDRKYDHKLILAADDPVRIVDPGAWIDAEVEHGWIDFEEDWVVRVPSTPSTEFLAQLISADVLAACKDNLPEARYIYVTTELLETPTITAVAMSEWDVEEAELDDRD